MLKRARGRPPRCALSQSRDLATLADELAAANRAKDEFLAVLSHELRTPLTPILNWFYLLREGQLDAPQRNAPWKRSSEVQLQARLIDDLLDVSRRDHGQASTERPADRAGVV